MFVVGLLLTNENQRYSVTLAVIGQLQSLGGWQFMALPGS